MLLEVPDNRQLSATGSLGVPGSVAPLPTACVSHRPFASLRSPTLAFPGVPYRGFNCKVQCRDGSEKRKALIRSPTPAKCDTRVQHSSQFSFMQPHPMLSLAWCLHPQLHDRALGFWKPNKGNLWVVNSSLQKVAYILVLAFEVYEISFCW